MNMSTEERKYMKNETYTRIFFKKEETIIEIDSVRYKQKGKKYGSVSWEPMR